MQWDFIMDKQMYKVQLDQFEGPLDLLLYFIRRDEIDIYDIPISSITSEYLQMINDMKAMNLSVAGDFILMAATLMRIKSKILLPRPSLDEDGEPIDPRTQLVEQLLEYQQFKGLSSELSIRFHQQSFRHTRSIIEDIEGAENIDLKLGNVTLFDLAKLFKEVMEKMPVITSYDLTREVISLDFKKEQILQSFDGDGLISFSRLLSACKNKIEMIITFLALLDLIRLFKVAVFQNNLFDDFDIHRLEKN